MTPRPLCCRRMCSPVNRPYNTHPDDGQLTGECILLQQGGGGVIFWAGICRNELIGPYKILIGTKLNSNAYCRLLENAFLSWLDEQPIQKRRLLIFQQDNAPLHKSRSTTDWLSNHGFKGKNLMVWPPNSPDLNPIKNLWSCVKRKIYTENKQFTSVQVLRKAIVRAFRSITPSKIRTLTSAVDTCLITTLKNGGCHVGL